MREVQHHPQEVADMRLGFYTQFQQSDFDLSDERKLFDWAAKQCYLPLANMMTVAAMRGIDSCPIEGFKQKETDALLAEQFGVNLQEYGLAYMVAFGYRKHEPRAKTRRALSQLVTWNALMLASIAANATVDNGTLVRAIGPADLSHSMLKMIAVADDDQADSSEAETMLA
ncbi:NADPH nitroreductase, putative [Ricinus communis]|uniref:NADPH nitroreductase, putative n=1 Tax=Ricinus communis TaxID=3988 RepID=B9TCC5_RICCO|nr:NADPH nitroreductase, putative [Ricinus communis]